MHQPIKTIISIAVAGMMANQAAYAGAFSLYTESSAAKIGNFAAGAAAEGTDASIGWYNPAGLVLIHDQQMVFSGVGIFPSSKLTGKSTFASMVPESDPPEFMEPSFEYFSGIQGAENAFVPALHYAKPLGSNATFGLSIVAPFGLSTNWGEQSPVRYQATLTDLKTIDVSPELGGKLTENLSIGGGIDFQWAQVKFNQVIGSPPFLKEIRQPPTILDTLSFNKGHSFAMGFHAGILGMFNDNHTRIGLNYQSKVKHQFNGYSLLKGPLANPSELLPPHNHATFRSNSLYSNDVSLPDMTTLSIYQDVNDRLALLGSAIYAGWSSFKTIQLNNVAAINGDSDAHALVNATTVEDYKNAWRFAVGANYRVTDLWMMRVGGGYDETPTVNAHRDARLPDVNRWALSIGAHYQMRPSLGFDLGYTYLWGSENAKVNNTNMIGEFSAFNVNATANNHVHLVGLQAVWTIDHKDSATTK